MWHRMMLAVASLQATGSQAYAPIQMVSGQGNGLVVVPKGFPSSIRGAIVPQKLSVRSPSANDTPSLVPYFTAKLDQTITWDEMGWCLEAIGSKPWDAVCVNSCTGVQTQKWTWIPDGSGQNMIQLKDTELCLDAIDQKAGIKGAQMALRGCGSKVARWQFAQPLLLPDTLQDDSTSLKAWHVIVVLLALAGIGAVSLGAWIWQCGAKGNQDLEMVPAVMVVSPSHPSRASQPRASCTSDVENTGDKDSLAQLDPPSLPGGEAFRRGAISEGSTTAWWRQDAHIFQLVVALPEDASLKRDVQLSVRKSSIALAIKGETFLEGTLARDIEAEDCDWYVEDDLAGFEGAEDARFLVIELQKRDANVDWQSPLQDDGGAETRLVNPMTVQSDLAVQSVSYNPVYGQNWDGYSQACCILASGNAHRRASALEKAAAYKYGSAINLDYPGLQIVFLSPFSGAPVFLIPQFLSDEECDRFVQRCSPEARAAELNAERLAHQSSAPWVTDKWANVTTVKCGWEETPGFHERVAELTNRRVENMEPVKIIHYQKGERLVGPHIDSAESALSICGPSGLPSLDGSSLPDHTSRELTLFIYLNTVTHGGGTAFYGPRPYWNRPTETFRIRPTKGLAVLFYTSLQPPSGQLPSDLSTCHRLENGNGPMIDYFCEHASMPIVDEKYLLAQWIWPPNVDYKSGLTDLALKLGLTAAELRDDSELVF